MNTPGLYTPDTVPEILGSAEARAAVRARCSEAEWAQRVELAAAFQLLALLGWDDLIFGHITAVILGPEKRLLIQPFGLLFCEVTASCLLKISLDGQILDPGSTELGLNPGGLALHTTLHRARDDIQCIMHTHEDYATAAACTTAGIQLRLTQASSMLAGWVPGAVARHTYSLVGGPEDNANLPVSLGPTAKILLLDNHGIVTCGATLPEAFSLMYMVTNAARAQHLALTMAPALMPAPQTGGYRATEATGRAARSLVISEDVCKGVTGTHTEQGQKGGQGRVEFCALKRRLTAHNIILHTL